MLVVQRGKSLWRLAFFGRRNGVLYRGVLYRPTTRIRPRRRVFRAMVTGQPAFWRQPTTTRSDRPTSLPVGRRAAGQDHFVVTRPMATEDCSAKPSLSPLKYLPRLIGPSQGEAGKVFGWGSVANKLGDGGYYLLREFLGRERIAMFQSLLQPLHRELVAPDVESTN